MSATAYPAGLDTVQSLIVAINNFATLLSNGINSVVTVIPVASIANLPEPGIVSIDGEVIYYANVQVSPPALLGCTRGSDGTTAASHAASARVEVRWVAQHHNITASAIAAVQAELGVLPKGDYASVAERLDNNLPVPTPITPTSTAWSITHDRHRLVGVQLWRKTGTNTYELFEANVEQIVNTSGPSNVNITLSTAEEGYIVLI
jgi:hypothetical protein